MRSDANTRAARRPAGRAAWLRVPRLSLTALATIFLALVLPASPVSADLYHPKPPAAFGPLGGSCPGGAIATATGDIAAATGSGDRSLLATGTGTTTFLATGTGNLTAGSKTVTNFTTTTGTFTVGQSISGGGIPNGTTIEALGPTTLTLSQPATQNRTGTELVTGSKTVTNLVLGAAGSGDLETGSTTIRNLATTSGAFVAGQSISGPGIQAGTTIASKSVNALFLSKPATATVTGVVLTASAGPFTVGQSISGGGIPNGTTIEALGPTTLTLSNPPTKTGSAVVLAMESRFVHATQLAFDKAAHRLYAIDETHPQNKLYGFDISTPGAYIPLPAPFPLAVPDQLLGNPNDAQRLAVDDGGLTQGNIYAANGEQIFGFSPGGSPLPGFPIALPPKEVGHSSWTALAVDPAGDLWAGISPEGKPTAYEYSPAGVLLNTVSVPGVLFSRIDSLAFDANGDLYAAVDSGTVWKLAAPAYSDPVPFLEGVSTVALSVDHASGDLYVATSNAPGPTVNRVLRYRFDGTPLEEFATGLGMLFGVAIDESSKAVYVSNNSQGTGSIYVFQASVLPDLALAPPSSPAPTTLTLHGSVGPSGLALSDCEFEYVTEAAYEATGFASLASGGQAPCSPASGSIPASGTTPVSAALSGLSEGVAYRYRLAAANANGTNTTKGAPGAFTLGKPGVETVGSPLRSATTARLDSRLDPHGFSTTYHFEYLDNAAYQANLAASEPPFAGATSTPNHPAGSGATIELVSQRLEELTPATTYHYRLIADNGGFGGPVTGAERTLTTRASDQPQSHGHFPGPPGSDRAWEQVSLPDSSGNPIAGAAAISDDGERAAYLVTGGTHVSETGTFYNYLYARRPAGEHPSSGWQTESVFPSRTAAPFSAWMPPSADGSLSTMLSLNRDLADGAAAGLWRIPTEGGAPSKLYEAKPGAYGELYLSSDDGSRAMLVLEGASIDKTHTSPGGVAQLYDVSSGEPHMTSLLPGDIAPSCGVPGSRGGSSIFGFRPINMERSTHWVAADGSRAFFPSAGNEPCGGRHLYMRDFGAEETVQVDGPLPGGLSGPAGPECPGALIRSTPTAAYFWTQSRLVEADTAIADGCSETGPGGDVYRYDLASHAFQCLTCVVPGGLPANVAVSAGEAEGAPHAIALAPDGSRLYFTTTTRLLPGAPETGTRTIYRVDTETGELAYVGPLEFGDRVGENPGGGSDHQGTAISPDGRFLAFRSAARALDALTGSDNGGSAQFYLYDDAERSLLCVSCPPDGTAPRDVAAQGIVLGSSPGPNLTSVADNGDFAFATPTALVPADQNTAPAGEEAGAGTDVYEWRDGRALLVSDGLTDWPTSNVVPSVQAIDPSGRDLFFTEAAPLTPDALDGYTRLYDARIGGGIDFPEAQKPCPLEVCQGTPKGAPEEAAPGSGNFSGPGNAKEGSATKPRCSKGKVRRKGRCVAKKPKRVKRAHPQARHKQRVAR